MTCQPSIVNCHPTVYLGCVSNILTSLIDLCQPRRHLTNTSQGMGPQSTFWSNQRSNPGKSKICASKIHNWLARMAITQQISGANHVLFYRNHWFTKKWIYFINSLVDLILSISWFIEIQSCSKLAWLADNVANEGSNPQKQRDAELECHMLRSIRRCRHATQLQSCLVKACQHASQGCSCDSTTISWYNRTRTCNMQYKLQHWSEWHMQGLILDRVGDHAAENCSRHHILMIIELCLHLHQTHQCRCHITSMLLSF